MVKSGNVCYVRLPFHKDGILGGKRPCVIMENESESFTHPFVAVIPITNKQWRYDPTQFHVNIRGLNNGNFCMVEQLQTVHRSSILTPPIAKLTDEELEIVKCGLISQFGLNNKTP